MYRTLLITIATVFAFSAQAEKVEFSTQQADLAIQCSELDFSKVLYGGLVQGKNNPNKIIAMSFVSWVDMGTNRKSKPIAAVEAKADGSCKILKVNAVTQAVGAHKPGKRFSSANGALFNCREELTQIKKAGLSIAKPTKRVKEIRIDTEDNIQESDIRTYKYPVLNADGKKVKTLTLVSEYDLLIQDDNDWSHVSCSLK